MTTGHRTMQGLTFWEEPDLWQVPVGDLARFIYSDRTTGPDVWWHAGSYWVSRDGSALTDGQKDTIRKLSAA